MYISGAILTIIMLISLFRYLPESVYFLMSKQPKNAQQRLHKIGQLIGKPGNCDVFETQTPPDKVLSFMQLLVDRYRRSTILICFAFGCIMFGFYFISS